MSRGSNANIRGVVESLNGEAGVTGWAVDLDRPDRSLELEILLGGLPIATTRTQIPRGDVEEALKVICKPGFNFPAGSLAVLAQLPPRYHDQSIALRVAGSDTVIPVQFGDDVGAWSEYLSDLGGSGYSRAELVLRLDALRERAADDLEWSSATPSVAGFIEAVAVDRNGFVWMVGWSRDIDTVDTAVRIIDRDTFHAGMVCVHYKRRDLEGLTPPAYAFVAILSTDWRPPGGQKVDLVLSPGDRVLRCNVPLRVVTETGFWAEYGKLDFKGRYAPAVRSYSRHSDAFRSERRDNVNCYVEEVQIIPGFGCVASGWLVTPHVELRSMAVRVGFQVAECDLGSSLQYGRDDIRHLSPKASSQFGQFGFTAAFRNPRMRDVVEACSLILRFADGSSTSIPVEPKNVLLIGHTAGPEAVERLFRSLVDEAFFGDFARAVKSNYGRRPARVSPFVLSKADRCCLFGVPTDRSEMARFFEALIQASRTLPDDLGVVLIAENSEVRPDVVARFRALKAVNKSASLVFSRTDWPTRVISEVLTLVSADRFAFVGPNVSLNSRGWDAIVAALSASSREIAFLEIDDPISDLKAPLSTNCFAWNVLDYMIWRQNAPTPIGFVHHTRDLPSNVDWRVVEHAGHYWAPYELSTLIAAINSAA